jgi:hypothetical protein
LRPAADGRVRKVGNRGNHIHNSRNEHDNSITICNKHNLMRVPYVH